MCSLYNIHFHLILSINAMQMCPVGLCFLHWRFKCKSAKSVLVNFVQQSVIEGTCAYIDENWSLIGYNSLTITFSFCMKFGDISCGLILCHMCSKTFTNSAVTESSVGSLLWEFLLPLLILILFYRIRLWKAGACCKLSGTRYLLFVTYRTFP